MFAWMSTTDVAFALVAVAQAELELGVDPKTSDALGLTVPRSLLQRRRGHSMINGRGDAR